MNVAIAVALAAMISISAGALVWGQNTRTLATLTTGQKAPDFTLPDTRGLKRKLSSYRGKFVVLEWVNFGCPFVRKHYDSGNMQSLQRMWTGKGVVWLSVNSSAPGKQGHFTPEEAEKIVEQNKAAPSAYLIDSNGDVGITYGARTTPHIFVIAPDGTLIYQGAIDSIASTDAADIKKSQNYLSDCLRQAMNGQPVATGTTKPYGCSVKY